MTTLHEFVLLAAIEMNTSFYFRTKNDRSRPPSYIFYTTTPLCVKYKEGVLTPHYGIDAGSRKAPFCRSKSKDPDTRAVSAAIASKMPAS